MTDFRPKNVSVKLEDFKSDTIYAFTYNLSDRWQYAGDDKRYNKFVEHSIKLLFANDYTQYMLYPELSPLGRLHWHGYIRVKDGFVMSFFMDLVPLLVKRGTISIVPLKHIEGKPSWLEYCRKQQHYFSDTKFKRLKRGIGDIDVDTVTSDLINDWKESQAKGKG